MHTKILYTLTSTEKDFYLEQALLSAYSCRMHNPDAEIILMVDPETNGTLTGKRAEIDKYITRRVVVECPEDYSQVMRSRYIKTTIRQHIDGDFIFIDTDTIITDSLGEADNFDGSIGVVPEFHCTLDEYPGVEGHHELAKKLGWTYDDSDKYNYNSGVIIAKDNETAHKFFKKWHECWLESTRSLSIHQDQPPMAMADHLLNHPITTLSGEWNCQILERGIYYLSNAKVIHYYGTSLGKPKSAFRYAFEDPQILYDIKELGKIPESVKLMVATAKTLINEKSQIIVGEELGVIYSQVYRVIKNVYFRHPSLFRKLEKICVRIGRLKGKK